MAGNKEAGSEGGRKGQDGNFICGKILLLGEYRQTDRQMGAQDTRWGRGRVGQWYLLTSKWKLHPTPQVRGGGRDNIGTGGGETGMKCPSLRRAAGQGPVLVGTIGSLWPSWVLGGGRGQGCWAMGMPGRRTLQGRGSTKASPWWGRGGAWVKDRITRGKYRAAAAAAAAKPPRGDPRSRGNLCGGHYLWGTNAQGLPPGASG